MINSGQVWEKSPEAAKTLAIANSIHKQEEHTLTFLCSPDVPLDYNASVRAICNIKDKLKVSAIFRALQKKYAFLRFILGTEIKNHAGHFQRPV